MALRIRLRRLGKKKEVHYRVVVTEARTAREGKFVEALGYFNPRVDPPEVTLNEERVRLWLERGAQPTETVLGILARQGIVERPQRTAQAETAATPIETQTPQGEVSADAGTDRDGGEGAS